MNTLKESLVEYKSSLEFAHKEAQEAKEESRRALLEVNELKKEVNGLKFKLAQTENLQEKLLSLETYSCRENLIFDGLPGLRVLRKTVKRKCMKSCTTK